MINTSTFPAVSRKIPRMGENTRYLCCHSSAAISSLFVILARYSWGLHVWRTCKLLGNLSY